MPKVKRNSDSHRRRKGVGTATLLDRAKGKWRLNCPRKGIPKQLQRPIVYGIREVENHFDKLEYFLKEHGRNKDKLLNKIDLDDLAIAVRYKDKFENTHSIKLSLEEVVINGIEKLELDLAKQDFPTLAEVIDDYIAFRATPEGNSKGDWIIDKNTITSEKTFLVVIKSEFGKLSLNEVFETDFNFKGKADKLFNRKWRNSAPKTLMDRARILRMTLDYALGQYPALKQQNPLTGWERTFNKARKTSGIKSILTPNEVRKIFERAADHSQWRINIPYMALLFFTGSRPFDVGDTKNAARRWDWSWFNGWKHFSSVSNGYIATLPPWNVDGTKASSKKTQVSQDRDLTPNGYEWIRWYFGTQNQTVPNAGKVEFSRAHWNNLRKELGLYGAQWEQDITRRTFATYAHCHWANQSEHWCEHIGHDHKTYRRYYKGKSTSLDAAEFFDISPQNINLESVSTNFITATKQRSA